MCVLVYLHVLNAAWLPHESVAGTETAWARAFVDALDPHHAGVYLNFLDHDDHHRTPEAFRPAAHQRLKELRHRYDPDRLFEARDAALSTP